MNHLNVFLKKEWTIFEFAVTADKNDNGFNLYSLNLTMKLNIPKCQCSITLFTTVSIVGGVKSCFLTLVILNIYQQNEAKTVSNESAVISFSTN